MAEDVASLKAEIERLKSENQELVSNRKTLTLKVNEKGGVSLYNLRRLPTTFYKDEWIRILDMGDEIRAFLEANNDKLKVKK